MQFDGFRVLFGFKAGFQFPGQFKDEAQLQKQKKHGTII
jgi:hypothetical protein